MQKVPRNHWKKLGNQKEFFLNLAKELKIKEPKKWGSISNSQVLERGGGGLLQIYGGSLRTALKTIFPDVKWKREWFKYAPQFPRNHWRTLENRKHFFDHLQSTYRLQTIEDWRKISLNFIR